MKLTYFKGTNFGDALNEYLLPRVFPDFFDEDNSTLFIGIGSILDNSYPAKAKKIVFGSGLDKNAAAPVIDDRWHIYAVRGQRTADALGINRNLVAADSAILIKKFRPPRPPLRHKFSFIPHWGSMYVGRWEQVTPDIGINLIDPRWPVERFLLELESTETVIAEAMHGAITADALRIPWIPLSPINKSNRFKWYDWAEALEIQLRPNRLAASSVQEALIGKLGPGRARWARGGFRVTGTERLVNTFFKSAARKSLQNALLAEPMLSSDRAMDRALDKLETSALKIKRDYPVILRV